MAKIVKTKMSPYVKQQSIINLYYYFVTQIIVFYACYIYSIFINYEYLLLT